MHRLRVPVLEKFRSPLRLPAHPPITDPAIIATSLSGRADHDIMFVLHASVGNEQNVLTEKGCRGTHAHAHFGPTQPEIQDFAPKMPQLSF